MTDEFVLIVNGKRYGGWTNVSIVRSIESLAHSYSVQYIDRWIEDGDAIPIRRGDECEIHLNDSRVTRGYVDVDSGSEDANTSSLEFSGRSKTCDLVDCAAIYRSGQWAKAGLSKIAKDLCDPFGISVSTEVDLGRPFTNPGFALQEGETVFEALSRAARMRGVLMWTDRDGNLVFGRRGSSRVKTRLVRGDNIISSSFTHSWEDRFDSYIGKAQSAGNDQRSGKDVTISRTATDDRVSRYRPTVILADAEDAASELQKRVDWERNVRAGRSESASYTVQGWEHSEGLWQPNTLVHVVDPRARLDSELLISSVRQSRGEQGTTTQIDVTLPEAFDVEPLPRPKKGSL